MANQSNTIVQGNGTNETLCYSPDENPVFRAGLIALYCVIFFASLLGNTLIVATVYSHVQMRSPVNLFIANMAVSDILQTIFGIPRVVTEVVFGRERWLLDGFLGNFTCKLVYFIQDTSLSVSIFSLICITVERLYAVVFPFKYSYLNRHSKKAIAAIWFTGISLHVIYWKVFTLHSDSKKCYQNWTYQEAMTYYLVVFVGLFFLALVTTILMYTIIIVKIKQKQVSGERLRRSKEAQERKLLRVVIAITVVFFACFFPQTVLIMVAPMYAIPVCHAEALRVVTKVMEQAYSAVNPILCMTFSANYRSGFISALMSVVGCVTSLCRRKTFEVGAHGQRDADNHVAVHEDGHRNYDEPPRELVTRNLVVI